MASEKIPFQPLRDRLYSAQELMKGFDPNDADSMGRTLDFTSYAYYISHGAAAPGDPYTGMMEALHDNSIGQAMTSFLDERKDVPVVAVMGGHNESRETDNFRKVAEISRQLSRAGCLVASGGGPGAMEATHLGALLAQAPDDDLSKAIVRLKATAKLPPNSKEVVGPTGVVNWEIVRLLHAWAKPAFELAQEYGKSAGMSLAIPTWYYGHEPVTPVATDVAKYFQNSIREDVLLALAANGIIYTQGSAGTLQEVFQDAAQNYYRAAGQPFAPMVFFGQEFWTQKLPVVPLLENLFCKIGKMSPDDFKSYVVIVDTVDDAVKAILAHKPSGAKTQARLAELNFKPLQAAARMST